MAATSDVLRLCATKIFPAGFVLGACMEGFMYATGFWGVATRKESERQVEAAEARQALRTLAADRYNRTVAATGASAALPAGATATATELR